MYNEHIKKFPYCFRAFLADISNLDIISADGEDMFPESYIGGYLSWFLEKNKFDIIESQLKEALSIIEESLPIMREKYIRNQWFERIERLKKEVRP